jgi:hypothetical protein
MHLIVSYKWQRAVAGHSSINHIFQFHSVLDFFGKKKMKKKNLMRLKQGQET